ncbi:Hypothetical predicted protein, partial [Mytilus galloprovincialis]
VVDHCKPDPCLHSGWCVSTTNGYTCQCTSRYTGKNCQTYVTTSTAQSTTTATPTSWIKVTQPTSWKKITLPTSWLKVTLPSIAPTTAPTDHCKPDPCKHSGWCINNGSDYSCQCLSRYTGKNCELLASASG